MKKITGLILIAALSLTGCAQYTEKEIEVAAEEATTVITSYDLNGDGILEDNEYQTYVKHLYEKNGGTETTTKEIEDAVDEASATIGSFDTNEDGDLSYEEKLSLLQKIYEKYDNGEIKDENLRAILEGFERKVNELNSYHDLLEEVGVGGPNIQINLRGDE